MNHSLMEILEHAPGAVLLLDAHGQVLAANDRARLQTGLSVGQQLFDAGLLGAVQQVARQHQPVSAAWRTQGDAPAVSCRVLPGPGEADAFIMLGEANLAHAGAPNELLLPLVRSDLLAPLRRAHAALRLARDAGDDTAAAALTDEIDTLLQAMDKLVDLASVQQARGALASERVLLWPLLQQAWAEVEPLALELGVQVRFTVPGDPAALPAMFGSQAWLHRLFTESLEAGLRASAPGSVMDVEHMQAGARALVIFRDSGLFRPGAPVREEVARRLCQQIARMHGGSLRTEADRGVTDLLIDLPTGAPFQRDESHLIAAQAQRLAAEREALKARAEKRRAQADTTNRAACAAAAAVPTGAST